MTEAHYDDETLISILESAQAAADAHLPSCGDCASRFQSFRTMASLLGEADVWAHRPDGTAAAGTIATLRSFASGIREEERRAGGIVQLLLATDSTQWASLVASHPEWRTAGLVRALINATGRIIDTKPPDAVELTAICTDIAGSLPESAYPGDTVRRLRGAAWRERAYALYYTGRFAEANGAVERAEAELAECSVSDYDNARVGIVDALVLRALEEFEKAERSASSSAGTFERFGDVDRLASARMAEAQMMMSRRDFAAARELLMPIEEQLRGTEYAETHARLLGNLGYCARELGAFDESLRWYELSTQLLEALGIETEAIRNRWNVAEILASAGRHVEALQRLEQVRDAFERKGMTIDATLASLDMAELMLVESARFDEIEMLCRRALAVFEAAGLSYSRRAMTAVAFMREAVQKRTASRALVRSVREYLRRLPAEPTLLFAPPA